MAKSKVREASFESSLASLEQIVHQLESGDLPLERALELFEEGVRLARRCQDQLSDVEQRVEILLRERGELKTASFEMPRETEKTEKTEKRAEAEPPEIEDSAPEADEGDDLDESIPF